MRFSFFIFFGFLISLNYGCTNEIKNTTDTETMKTYSEKHRPQFHFSPEGNWMNDPNGMFYYEGEYHLFYQYYPDSNVWGPMHWAHAVSTDLTHWEHLPIALYPDSLGYIFSGSAVVDWNNTSGFGTVENPPIIAIFTYHDMVGEKSNRNDFQYQGIAYSNDKGRTWTKYEKNPVIPNLKSIRDFRDPKVIWDEEHEQWLMIFAVKTHDQLWASKDLKSWRQLSEWGEEWGKHGDGPWECPDIFPMKVEGTDEEKWVIIQSLNPDSYNGGSGTQYFIGDFDGTTFTLDKSFEKDVTNNNAVWLDYGRDNYAGVTWSDIPNEDGRKLFIGWMSNWDYAQIVPTTIWRSAMTLPRSLVLKNTDIGYRIFSNPVKELAEIRQNTSTFESTSIENELELSDKINAAQSEIDLSFTPSVTTENFGIELSNDKGEVYRLGYDRTTNVFYSDRTKSGKSDFSEKFAAKVHTAPRFMNNDKIHLQAFFDAGSAELFADNGAINMTDIFFPTEDFNQIKIFTIGGKVEISGTTSNIMRIWE